MIAAERVTVDTTSGGVLIAQGPSVSKSHRLNVRNRGSVAVYVGPSGVTSSTGYQLDPGEQIGLELAAGETLYGITASSSAAVHVLKAGT